MRKIILIFFLVLISKDFFATHNQGGFITWVHVSGFTYKLRITTLTEVGSPGGNADRCKLTIYINHTDSLVLPRINGPLTTGSGLCVNTHDGVQITSNSQQNIYEGTYTFPCQGKFNLSTYDPNRNANIINIPNSVNIPMYFESEIVVPLNNYTCSRNSADLYPTRIQISNAPNQKYYPYTMNYNGDSLAYSVVPCQMNNGQNIPGYSSTGFSINSLTGEITSNATTLGQYNLCYKIKMFRKGEYIGSINYDHSVNVVSSSSVIAYNSFASGFLQINGVYQLSPSQTFTLSGSATGNPNWIMLYQDYIGSSTVTPGASFSTFTMSVVHSTLSAREEPYRFYLHALSMPSNTDTLIRIKILGGPINTCSLMGITTTTCFVGLKESDFDHFDFSIYPSLTNSELNLKGSYKKIALMDVSGKLIEPAMISSYVMNVENLASGIYILSVTDPNNRDHYYKFLKR
jgi:hypothetical protein